MSDRILHSQGSRWLDLHALVRFCDEVCRRRISDEERTVVGHLEA